MKVIFLDFDGVITTMRSVLVQEGVGIWSKPDPIAVQMIAKICRKSGAKLVISSTWRMGGFDHCFETLEEGGWKDARTFAHTDWKTPRLINDCRGVEIHDWIMRHPEVETFAIIDDDSDMLDEQMPFFVHTDTKNGFSWENFQTCIRILGTAEEDFFK